MYSSLGSLGCIKKVNTSLGSFSNKMGNPSDKINIPPYLAPRSHDISMWNEYGSHSQTNSNRPTLEPVYSTRNVNLNPVAEKMYSIALSNVNRKSRKDSLLPPQGDDDDDDDDDTPPHPARNFVQVGVGDKTDLLKSRRRPNVSPYEIMFPNQILSSNDIDQVDNYILNKPENVESSTSGEPPSNSYESVPSFEISKFDKCGDGKIHPNGPHMPSNLNVPDHILDRRFQKHNRELHTQTIQPGAFSTHMWNEPLNNNIGISHNSESDVINVKQSNGLRYYHRVDPQLVRNDVSKNRQEENPPRNGWSTELGLYPEDMGSIKLENIYDPRHNGYGDENRSYTDITTGQVRYYYGDVDAYKRPNFISRTNVDHIDFMTPNGAILPEYHRRVGAENFRNITESTYSDNVLAHRESMMESLMRKRNSEMWQKRAFPKRSGAGHKCASFI